MLRIRLTYDEREVDDIQQFPCRDLIASLIERAILDLRQPKLALRMDARKWLFSKATTPWSFLWCLHMLDIQDTVHFIRNKARALIHASELAYIDMRYLRGNIFEVHTNQKGDTNAFLRD